MCFSLNSYLQLPWNKAYQAEVNVHRKYCPFFVFFLKVLYTCADPLCSEGCVVPNAFLQWKKLEGIINIAESCYIFWHLIDECVQPDFTSFVTFLLELTRFGESLLSAIFPSKENNSLTKVQVDSSGLCLLFPNSLIWFCLSFSFIYFVCFSNAEKLADRKLNVAEVTQSEIGQKQKLQTVLEAVHDLLRPHGWTIKWNVDCKDSVIFSVSESVLSLRKSAKSTFLQCPPAQWKASGWVCLSVLSREGLEL